MIQHSNAICSVFNFTYTNAHTMMYALVLFPHKRIFPLEWLLGVALLWISLTTCGNLFLGKNYFIKNIEVVYEFKQQQKQEKNTFCLLQCWTWFMLSLLNVTIEKIHSIFCFAVCFFLRSFFPNKPHVSNRSCPEREKNPTYSKEASAIFLFSSFNSPWFIISSGIVNSVVTLFWLMPIACKRFVLLIRFALFLKQADFSAFVIVCVGSANACICSIGVNIMLRNDHF